MVWYNLRIGSFHIKYTSLKPREIIFPYCDSDGNELKRVVEGRGKTTFINPKGEKVLNAFRLVKGKPMAKLSKTKEVDNYKEVDKNEVDDLIVEKQYIVESDILLNELKTTNKVLKFGFTFGNGFKVYKAYIHTSQLYPNFLFMSVGTTQKSEILQEITLSLNQKKKVDELDLTLQGIERAKVEDLIQI